MTKILRLLISLSLLLLAACDLHEWPELSKHSKLHLRLKYETKLTKWEHLYDGTKVTELGIGKTYDNQVEFGEIRYIIRAYPILEKRQMDNNHAQEFVFTKDITDGYDHEVTLDLQPGNYNIMVWSDLVKTCDDIHFYNADNFMGINLQGEHSGNIDHRDAFRGSSPVSPQ